MKSRFARGKVDIICVLMGREENKMIIRAKKQAAIKKKCRECQEFFHTKKSGAQRQFCSRDCYLKFVASHSVEEL